MNRKCQTLLIRPCLCLKVHMSVLKQKYSILNIGLNYIIRIVAGESPDLTSAQGGYVFRRVFFCLSGYRITWKVMQGLYWHFYQRWASCQETICKILVMIQIIILIQIIFFFDSDSLTLWDMDLWRKGAVSPQTTGRLTLSCKIMSSEFWV